MNREIKCSKCGKLATHTCKRSGQWICGVPLCDDKKCIEKHIMRVHPCYFKDWRKKNEYIPNNNNNDFSINSNN